MSPDMLAVSCPVCAAAPGEKCITLGQKIAREVPHAPRERAALKAAKQSEALSYGVRCNECGAYETSCQCHGLL